MSADLDSVEPGQAPGSVTLLGHDETIGSERAGASVPLRLGRYLVLDKLGEGGMGIVHAAYDTALERKVAIKLLRGGTLQRRLQREAKALARLSHPNVVQIYEIAEFEGSAFIVMEFVNGSTLADWLSERPRSQAEILAVFGEAGRGLSAAHDGGLIHRDFKPSNVMVGRDGRVLVMDFGLARGRVDTPDADMGDPSSPREDLSVELTRAGVLVGTPAYMAPEQFARLDADARSDQFSFCVALWEALHGRRPFTGENLAALASAIAAGHIAQPTNSDVSAWLRRVLERGLAPQPERRWPSMRELLDALARDPTRRRRARVRAAGALVAVVGVGVGVGVWREVADVRERDRVAANEAEIHRACAAGARASELDWEPETQARLEQVFVASGLPSAEQTWAHTRDWMDDYAARWAELRLDACVTAHSDSQLAEQATATLGCLDERRVAFAVLLDVWSEPDSQVIWRAPLAASSLPPLSSCVATTAAAPPGVEYSELRRSLEQLDALRLAGKYDRARALADELSEQAEAKAAPAALAELRLSLGRTRADLGDYEGARLDLHQCLLDAIGCGEDRIALRAAIELTQVVGRKLEQHQRGIEWAELGDRLLQRTALAGSPDHASLLVARGLTYDAMGRYRDAIAELDEARGIREAAFGPTHPSVAAIVHDIGDVQRKLGDYDDALASLQLALELREAALGDAHPDVAISLQGIGNVLYAKGDYRGALASFRRVVTIREASLGREHPDVAAALSNVGSTEADLGDHQQALETLARALAIYEQSLGPDHPNLAYALHNIGISHMRLGQLDASLAAHRRALAIREAVLSPDHPLVAASLNSVGVVQMELGQLDGALASHRRALAIRETALEDDNPEIGFSLANIGVVHVARGEYAEALDVLRRARAIWQRTLGPTHPIVGQIQHEIGTRELELGDLAGARASFEAALAIRETSSSSPSSLAETRFALAQVVWRAGERDRARELAKAAADGYRAAGPDGARELAAVEAWLDRR